MAALAASTTKHSLSSSGDSDRPVKKAKKSKSLEEQLTEARADWEKKKEEQEAHDLAFEEYFEGDNHEVKKTVSPAAMGLAHKKAEEAGEATYAAAQRVKRLEAVQRCIAKVGRFITYGEGHMPCYTDEYHEGYPVCLVSHQKGQKNCDGLCWEPQGQECPYCPKEAGDKILTLTRYPESGYLDHMLLSTKNHDSLPSHGRQMELGAVVKDGPINMDLICVCDPCIAIILDLVHQHNEQRLDLIFANTGTCLHCQDERSSSST